MNFKNIKSALAGMGSSLQDHVQTAQQKVSEPQVINVGSRQLQVDKLLGEGGYAYVYQVTDAQTGEKYALKKVIIQSKQAQASIKNEIKLWSSLSKSGHPNIIKFIDAKHDP